MMRRYNELSPVPVTPRTGEQVARFFGGLDVIEPGVVPMRQWWAPGDDAGAGSGLAGYCRIGRKPRAAPGSPKRAPQNTAQDPRSSRPPRAAAPPPRP